MKAFLLYKDKDYIYSPYHDDYSDLWFNTIIENLCSYDKYIKQIYEDASNLMTTDIETIKYRQDILKDCIRNKNIIINFYSVLTDLLQTFYNNRYEIKLNEASATLNAINRISSELVMALENMNRYFSAYSKQFKSEGLTRYMNEFIRIFNMDFIAELREMFEIIKFKKGMYVLASLDENLNPANYELYNVIDEKKEVKKILKPNGVQLRNTITSLPEYDYTITEWKKWKHAYELETPRASAATEADYMHQTDNAVLPIINRIASVVNDIVEMLTKTREEMAFYIGGINLYDKLMGMGISICTPKAEASRMFKCDGLVDLALALQNDGNVVGNTLNGDSKEIFFISGANQGGKTTFLRSYGQAIIMMQLGLFVSGKEFVSGTYKNVFTHFNKEEDKSMTSGKLDEELSRLRDIIGKMSKDSLILFNESFQSTSEVEGSMIAYDIIRALNEKNIAVVIVSHMYKLYKLLDDGYQDKIFYLRASRDDSGKRSYKLENEKPLETSFALDLYEEIF